MIGLGAVAGLAPEDGVPESALGCVVCGRDAGQPGERPQRAFVREQAVAEAPGLWVAAAGALGEQVADRFAPGVQIARERGQIVEVAAGR